MQKFLTIVSLLSATAIFQTNSAYGEAVSENAENHEIAINSEESGMIYMTVEVPAPGELADILGTNINTVETLRVSGPIDGSDLKTILDASVEGSLMMVDLNKTQITDNTIPDSAFSVSESEKEGTEVRSKLTTVILPSGVTKIGKKSFYGCYLLSNLTLPESLMTIEEMAFAGCSSLDRVSLPASVTELGASCFNG